MTSNTSSCTTRWCGIPNLLTLGRIVLIVPFVGAFYLSGPIAVYATVGLFAAAAISDFLDGWLARRLGQTSTLGRVLDPIADKLMVGAALVMLTAEQRASAIAVAAILVRELLISGLREGLAGRLVMSVSWLGKAKTASQMAAILLLLIAPVIAGLSFALAGQAMLWLAVALSWGSAFGYLRHARAALGQSAGAGGR
jgi:CDP-diacylglycerol--glycerol-3-phosphate 3-phosphatidyltransferase